MAPHAAQRERLRQMPGRWALLRLASSLRLVYSVQERCCERTRLQSPQIGRMNNEACSMPAGHLPMYMKLHVSPRNAETGRLCCKVEAEASRNYTHLCYILLHVRRHSSALSSGLTVNAPVPHTSTDAVVDTSPKPVSLSIPMA